jgi:hypothetical protein
MDKPAHQQQALRAIAQLPPFEALIGAKTARIAPASVRSIASTRLLMLGDFFQTIPSRPLKYRSTPSAPWASMATSIDEG